MNWFAFRYPNEDFVYCGISEHLNTKFTLDSFVIVPFFNSGRIISIPRENDLNIEELSSFLHKQNNSYKDYISNIYGFPSFSTTKVEHTEIVEEIKDNIKTGNLEKCIAARVIIGKGTVDLLKSFKNLCNSYQNAFVFLFHTPLSGTWLGASPELLLSKTGNEIKSMALAGTRDAGSRNPWDDKNLKEHNVVRDFIANVFESNNIIPKIGTKEVLNAGPVDHLMTKISGSADSSVSISKLLSDLSPTPAISGFPRTKAMNLIKTLENFDRGFYGGFCGWIDSHEDIKMFVNLRSMLIESNKYCIFAGGGIMQESDADCEWSETEKKASTLLSKIVIS